MNFRIWVKKHAKEILLGVIVSIITAGIMKAFEWIAEIAPTAGNSVLRFISNSFFSSAAKMSETSLITLLFAVLIGLGVAYISILLSQALGTTKKAITDAEGLLDDICNPKPRVHNESKEITKAELKTEVESIIKDAKKGRRTTIIGIIFFVLYFGFILVFDYVPHGLWTAYQRDLIKIAPYIEQQELNQIKSNWVCMQSKEDYEEIYKQIDKIKNEHNLP